MRQEQIDGLIRRVESETKKELTDKAQALVNSYEIQIKELNELIKKGSYKYAKIKNKKNAAGRKLKIEIESMKDGIKWCENFIFNLNSLF